MVRRLKKDVLSQLPPLIRTVVRVEIKKEEEEKDGEEGRAWFFCRDEEAETEKISPWHAAGLSKVEGAVKWIKERFLEGEPNGGKLVLFGHHHLVMDRVQLALNCVKPPKENEDDGELIEGSQGNHSSNGLYVSAAAPPPQVPSLVKIDGRVQGEERMKLLRTFEKEPKCRVAIIGITAGGVGEY